MSVGLAAINAPVAFSGIKITSDIAYGDRSDQKLDIYMPKSVTAQAPVIVFFYGGRWREGRRQDYAFVAKRFVEKGYIVVIPDYAKYPAVRFPAFVEDAAKAIAWTHDNISRYGGDAGHVYVSGHSAGAHIGALVVSDSHYLKAEGQTPTIVKAFAGLAGPYDFVPDEPDLIDMFGPPENYPKMQVTSFITGHEPPMLLLWGEDDTTVRRSNMDKLAAKIREKGGAVETKTYPGIDHIWLIAAFSWAGSGKGPVADDVVNYFNRHR